MRLKLELLRFQRHSGDSLPWVQACKTLGGLCYLLGKQSECGGDSSFRRGFSPILRRVLGSGRDLYQTRPLHRCLTFYFFFFNPRGFTALVFISEHGLSGQLNLVAVFADAFDHYLLSFTQLVPNVADASIGDF